jgi:Ca2+/Na+ antiporter
MSFLRTSGAQQSSKQIPSQFIVPVSLLLLVGVVGAVAGEAGRIYNKPISEKRHSDTRDRRKKKSLIQRGPIILIVGGALFVAGIIIAVVWATQFASTFANTFLQERNTLINRTSIEPGSSVEAATTQVTDISRPITVAIHIQRLGEREAAEGDGLQQRYNNNYNCLEHKEKRD